MRKALAFSFVALGFFALGAQVLLIRELLIVFYGNEFFIAWTMFLWLLWTGLGALLCGCLGAGSGNEPRRLVACQLLSAGLLPAIIVFIRGSRLWAGAVPGAVPNLMASVVLSFGALAPLGLVLGAQFVLGARAWKGIRNDTDSGRILGRAYAYETAGFVVAGLLFSFFLVRVNEFRVASLLGGLNAVAAAVICAGFGNRSKILRVALAAVLAAVALTAVLGGRLQRATSAWRFPGQELVESRNSIYGNLAVTRIGDQQNFYENGYLLGAEDEQMASEQLVHFPMLWHPAPRRVLLVGNGFNGALHEILKHSPPRVDCVELDPALIELARELISPARLAALADPRVNPIFADARFFLHQLDADGFAATYDVVMVNLPDPGTALINRFYTLEFYRDVRRQLAPGGVLAVRLGFAPDYLSRELEDLGSSIYRTLHEIFATVSILPEYEIYYLATTEVMASPTPAELIARFHQRGLITDFVIPPYIEYRLTTGRISKVLSAFDANRRARVNRDEQPIACTYSFIRWLSSFHPRLAALAGGIGEVRWTWAALAAAIVVGMALSSRGRGAHRMGAWAMGLGSFSLMACELNILLAFQVFRGYLYYKLALVIAALMFGMALGTAIASILPGRMGGRTLAGIHGLIATYAVACALFLRHLGTASLGQSDWLEWAFLLLAAAIGGLIGFEFPVANRIYLGTKAQDLRKAGVIYGVDLLGSCLGALLVGLWFLPVLGTVTTLTAVAGLNAAVAIIAAIATALESSRRLA